MRVLVPVVLVVLAGLCGCSDEPDGADETSSLSVSGDRIDCDEEALSGGDDTFVFGAAYRVVDGELGELCFGDDDPILTGAWADLVTIAPADQLGDLVLFAGYEPDGSPADDTFAFVTTVDSDDLGFQMSINTEGAVDDPIELLLTLAHEYTHVFTATADQLDRTDGPAEDCDTYQTVDGCFVEGSLMAEWVDEFWDEATLAGLDPRLDSVDQTTESSALAEERCRDDDGFFGAYAATNPEEDFAEAFSAFVFDLDPSTDGQADRLAWLARQPGLAEYRDRAAAAGLTPIDNDFEVCGL